MFVLTVMAFVDEVRSEEGGCSSLMAGLGRLAASLFVLKGVFVVKPTDAGTEDVSLL
jgi:hypothetical protein